MERLLIRDQAMFPALAIRNIEGTDAGLGAAIFQWPVEKLSMNHRIAGVLAEQMPFITGLAACKRQAP